jgi:hypothetical protein
VSDDDVQPPDHQNLGRNKGGIEPGLFPSGSNTVTAAGADLASETSSAAASASGRLAIDGGWLKRPRVSKQSPILGVWITGATKNEI